MLVNRLQKNKERIQNFKETRNSEYIYQNELEKACFQHDIAHGGFKDLSRRTAENLKYGYQPRLASIVYKFFDRKTSDSDIKNENISNKESAEELHKLIIRKFVKRKVHSPFTENTWGADLADVQLVGKFDKGFSFLLWVIDIFSKYA